MFKFDSSTHLTSPNLEGDLKSAKTHNLLSANPSYNDLPSDSDENICSPLFSRVTNEHRKLLRIKIRKISNSKKNPQFFKILKKPNKNFFLKMKDSISIQNKRLSSESFEKVLNERREIQEMKSEICLISENKECNTTKVEHYEFKKGQIIEKKFKVLTHVSDGTFGRVFTVQSLTDDKIYAMKVIRAIPKYIDTAKDEAKILNNLKQKNLENFFNIVDLFETFESGGNYFMIFEKLGASLYDFIAINKFLGYPLKLLQSVFSQILFGLNFLHSLKLTHTDLKPENILFVSNKVDILNISKLNNLPSPCTCKDRNSDTISQKGSESCQSEENTNYFYPQSDQIKIIDLGGATYEFGLHSQIINTRQYRAPEVILGCCEWSHASDLWSLGCIIVELYTGKLFFDTHDNYEHVAMIEKAIGNIPFWMANRSESCWDKYFILEDEYFNSHQTYFNYSNKCSNLKSLFQVKSIENLDQIIHPDHYELKDLLKKMLSLCPKRRISCQNALTHNFFKINYRNDNNEG